MNPDFALRLGRRTVERLCLSVAISVTEAMPRRLEAQPPDVDFGPVLAIKAH